MRPLLIISFLSCLPLSAAELSPEKGKVPFKVIGDQKNVPTIYHMKDHTFDYQMKLKKEMPTIGIKVYDVQFPSPIKSPHEVNNTVHAEYYLPEGKGPFPGVVVLHITGGDQTLSKSFSTYFAQQKIAALFVQMAYYGPRRPKVGHVRLLSTNLPRTFAGIQQTVLDIRRASAWLAARPEVDAKRLGLMGTSLGSMIGALAAEMEPRFKRVAMLLGGGGLVDAYYDHPQAAPYRKVFEAFGGKKDQVKKLFEAYDPLTKAANLKDRKLLILAGKKDEIVPPKMAQSMWEASGKQKIIWYDCGHYTAILYLIPALREIVAHFH